MTELLELLDRKLSANDKHTIDELNYRLAVEYGVSPTARDEVTNLLQHIVNGDYPKNEAYDFLYKFIDFYYDDESYLSDYADLIVYAISQDMIDPIDGSRLISAIWAVIGYPKELVELIGLEGEVEAKDNRLKNKEIDEQEKRSIENELDQIRTKLISIAKEIVENNTF
jgi:hypothetical protein